MQFVVPAEELRCGQSSLDLRRLNDRLETVLALATDVCAFLEPRNWQLLRVRFDDEVSVVLVTHATAEMVSRDLAQLPSTVLALLGDVVHICVTAGEHVFELGYANGALKPLNAADSYGL